ncbi:MAG TPA: hypothetical protein VND91_01370 [Candidatus Saccharimonadia bacterium]|nr:hypothetical protein [Candidatus Saccharimonadia bacterium]
MTPRLRAWLAALPDAATAVGFGFAWVVPHTVGIPFVRAMFVTFLLEFLAVHAGGMLAGDGAPKNPSKNAKTAHQAAAAATEPPARSLAVPLAGFALFYLVFAATFCLVFGMWWALVSFAFLLLAKMMPLLTRAPGESDMHGGAIWATSVFLYLTTVFATLFLPIPELGLDEATRASLDLPGTGIWIDDPERALSAGFIYFVLMAWTRGSLAGAPASR